MFIHRLTDGLGTPRWGCAAYNVDVRNRNADGRGVDLDVDVVVIEVKGKLVFIQLRDGVGARGCGASIAGIGAGFSHDGVVGNSK